jgi:pyruvate ferredoxin oxidoreductase delta subunit
MPYSADELEELPYTTFENARRTGEWRFQRPELDEDDCVTCERCIDYCPDFCIEEHEDGEYVVVDYDFCKGCGICAAVCPTDAFIMEVE